MFQKCLIAFSFLISGSVSGQNEDSLLLRRLADEILVNGRAYDNLKVLCKMIGGRLAGSPQMYKAEQWAVQTLKQTGLSKVWLQECQVQHWIRGGKDQATATVPGTTQKLSLDVLALGNSVGTGVKGITASLIPINTFDELESEKDRLKGRVVFFNYKFNPRFVRTFDSYGDAVRYRAYGASRAAKYGAVAVLMRSMTHGVDNNPHTGSLIYSDSFAKIPAAAIGVQDADKLAQWLKGDKTVNVYLRTNGKMLRDTVGHNVVGELTGTDFPDEIITVGGHLDSWDPGEGAHDDGAGCVHAIEAIRALRAIGYQPKRTIRVVLFANEENGLRGGQKYAEEAKAKNEKHYFALESDDGGFTPRGFGFEMKKEQFDRILKWSELFKPYGGSEWTQGGGGADIAPLAALGTPLAGFMPDSQRYFDVHHSRGDVFENVNKRELELGAVNIAGLIYLIDKYGL